MNSGSSAVFSFIQEIAGKHDYISSRLLGLIYTHGEMISTCVANFHHFHINTTKRNKGDTTEFLDS